MPCIQFTYPQPMNLTPLLASGNSTPTSLVPRSSAFQGTFHGKFTLGSLTNATFNVQVLNPDAATWETLIVNGVAVSSGVLAASTNFALPFAVPGCKQVRLAYVTTGVTTGSLAIIDLTTQA